jgi:RNA polymerase sigma-54 factor
MVDIGDDGQVRVWLPESNTPSLYISKSYQKLARDRKTAADARQFLQKNIRSAQWLIGAIKQRRETVRRVACEVFAFQREFVFHGPEAMKPLPMANVAAKVGIHVATVSRAVAGKYAQTPWGIFPLRSFFSGGTTTAGGEHVSWDVVKLKLKELIGAEDKQHPLDDETLAAEMQKHGIKIARRTVAKYRELLEIPPARRRRQF